MQKEEPQNRGLGNWFREFLRLPVDQLAEDSVEQTPLASPRADWRVFVVLITSALMLTFRDGDYRVDPDDALALLHKTEQKVPSLLGGVTETLKSPENRQLTRLCYWSVWQLVTYVVVPILVIKLILRQRLRDYGLKVRGMFRFWWIYLGMYLCIFPAVVIVSDTASFQATYPFYQLAPGEPFWPRFWIWQMFYALQFISLEFFFRGFMVHGTKRQLGIYSIFVMMIPYCMIHFGKPLPETIGAIIAGIVLGFMSLKTRSIWLGAASHISVAVTMDFCAIARS